MQKTKTITAFFGKDTEFEEKLAIYETIRINGGFCCPGMLES